MMDCRTLSPHSPRARSASFPPAAKYIKQSTSLISHERTMSFPQSAALIHLPWLSALGCAEGRVTPAEAASSTARGAVVTHSDPCRFGASLGSRLAWVDGRGRITGSNAPSPCARPWEYPRVLDALADVVFVYAASSTPTKLGYLQARPRSSARIVAAQAWEQVVTARTTQNTILRRRNVFLPLFYHQ
ncbi:hypothetical protein DFH06DRAFT_1171210, partial [Mycena polygramma]